MPQLIRPSTREFTRQARRLAGFSFFDWLHGLFYARFPFFYIRVANGEHWLNRFGKPLIQWFAGRIVRRPQGELRLSDTYHGKVLPLEAAMQLVTVHEAVRLSAPEQVIPYALAREIVLQDPDHIVALECPCRASRPQPCYPLDVCLIVGEPFVGLLLEHNPRRARRISQAEAVQILREEQARGHVSHAFFKDAMLGRFYAICNCCTCCCGAMQAQRAGEPMLASSGYVAMLEPADCLACGRCAAICPFGAIQMQEDGPRVDRAACMGCGVCLAHCAGEALRLERAPERGQPLELHELLKESSRP